MGNQEIDDCWIGMPDDDDNEDCSIGMTDEELVIYYKKEIEALMDLLTNETTEDRQSWLEQAMMLRSELCSDRYHFSGREVLKAESHARTNDDACYILDHLKVAILRLNLLG